MQRAMLWCKCAAMHDPVRPVLKQPAVIGWEAKRRRVDLTIERAFNGAELLRRMRGWVTVDVQDLIALIERYGKLKVLDGRDLVVESADRAAMKALAAEMSRAFGDEAWLEEIPKTLLE